MNFGFQYFQLQVHKGKIMNRQGFFEWLFAACIVVGAIGIAVGYKYLTKAPDDNLVEEFCEVEIEKQTGMKIDLTPKSPEKNKRVK